MIKNPVKKLSVLLVSAVALATAAISQVTAFPAADANNDGWLEYKEFTGSEVDFKALDLNADDALSAQEYQAFIDDDAVLETSKTLIHACAAMRSYFLREKTYATSQAQLIETKLLEAPFMDAWGNEIAIWSAKTFPSKVEKIESESSKDEEEISDEPVEKKPAEEGKKPEVAAPVKAKPAFLPYSGLSASHRNHDLLTFFVARSAGADGAFGTPDDIYRSHSGTRVPTTEYHRRRARLSDGEAYQVAAQSWVHEQGYRLWLAISTYEAAKGKAIDSLDGLDLPSHVFGNGDAVDLFGRAFKLTNHKGLRALHLAKGNEAWQPEVSIQESAFVTSLMRRMQEQRSGGGNHPYNVQSLFQYCNQYKARYGRQPLSLMELQTIAGNNSYRFRDNYGGQLTFIATNKGKTNAVISLGKDQKPGGTGLNEDQAYYYEDDPTWDEAQRKANQNEYFNWHIMEKRRHTAFEEALKKARELEKAVMPKLPSDAIRKLISEFTKDTSEAVRKKFEEELKNALAEEKKAKEAPKKKAEKGAGPKEDRRRDDDGVNDAPEEPEPKVNPAPPVAEKAAEGAEAKKEAEGAKEGEEEDPEAEEAKPFAIAKHRDLIPNRLYTQEESTVLEIITETSWEAMMPSQRVRYLNQSVHQYLRAEHSKKEFSLPFGNLAAAENRPFRVSEQARQWRSQYEYYEDTVEHYFTAPMGFNVKNGTTTSILSVALLPKGQGAPIFLAHRLNGNDIQLFAIEDDQPDGWREAMIKVTKDPEPKKADAKESEGDSKPKEDTKSEGEKVDEIKREIERAIRGIGLPARPIKIVPAKK